MRIGLFSDTYLPDINGVVSSVELLRKKLEEMGNEVYVICTYPGLIKVQREGNIIRLPGIEFKKLYGYAVTTPFHYFLIDDIKDLNLDIIHVHTEFGVGIFAQICADKLHIPLVRTYHTTYEDYTHYVNFLGLDSIDKGAKKIIANLSKMYGEKCMHLISPSKKTRDMLLRYNIKTKIDIIPTGTELERFNPDNTDKTRRDEIRKEFNIADDEKMLLYVGRIAQEKSIDMLLRTFRIIKDKQLKIRLVVIGGGPDLDSLKDMAKNMNIDDYVVFADKRPFDTIPAYYHSADAFVSASTTETQGMTYIEALASECVIFARRDECVEELLDEGINGYYFDNEEELAEKIEIFMSLDDIKIKEMSKTGRLKVNVYDANIFGQNIFKIYEESIAEYRRFYTVKSIKLKTDYVLLELVSPESSTEEIIVSLDTFYEKGIRKDDIVSLEMIDELKKDEAITNVYKSAIKKLSIKDYTVKEMYDYLLNNFELPIEEVNGIIDRLEEKGLLDDYKYAINKCDSLERKLFSRRHIINTLKKNGISLEIIDDVVKLDNDAEFKKALKIATKYQNSIKDKSLNVKKQYIIKKVVNEGFDYQIAIKVLESLDFSYEVYNEKTILSKETDKLYKRLSKKYSGTELRNRMYYSLISKGFSSETVYAILNEKEWSRE